MKFLIFFIYLCVFAKCDNSLSVVDTDSINHTKSCDSENNQTDRDVLQLKIFNATNEWQEINDTILPKGLHVRINLETGRKEAKLLENLDELDTHSRITTNYQKPVKKVQFVASNADFLKNLNDFKEKQKEINRNIKTLEETKDELKVSTKSESYLLKKVLDMYSNENNLQTKLTLLDDIEYYSHSIDLAKDLYTYGGLRILVDDLNLTTNNQLKASILNVLGSTIQGNDFVKTQLYKEDFLRKLVILLKDASDVNIAKKCLFTLSAFLRQFPDSQKKFFYDFGGMSIFEKILSQDLKLALKVATLLSDLAIESSTANFLSKDTVISSYKEIDYEQWIQKSDLCPKVVSLLKNKLDSSSLIVITESMNGLANVCNGQFKTNIDLFHQVRQLFEKENNELGLELITNLLNSLTPKQEL